VERDGERVRLVLATRNRHKVEELSALLVDLPIEILSFHDLPDLPEVVEDGATLRENAIKKAKEVAEASGLPALADDTGLEVRQLGGAPGVRSARYASDETDWEANNRKLLRELAGVPAERRDALFRCVVALARPGGRVETVEGVTRGRIIGEERGEGGFGYDPLFLPDGHDSTYAEMDPGLKNAVSHRGRAIKAALALIRGLLDTS
jgi:XTP/dITP diphosphohydrolase